MGLLHVLFGVFLDILAQAVLDEFLILLNRITAGITDGHLCVLCFGFTLLAELATAFLCQRRKDQTDRLAVVRWSQTDVGVDDGTLDLVDELLLPRRDSDGTGVRSSDRCARSQRRHSSVVINLDRIQDTRVGFSCTDVLKCVV